MRAERDRRLASPVFGPVKTAREAVARGLWRTERLAGARDGGIGFRLESTNPASGGRWVEVG